MTLKVEQDSHHEGDGWWRWAVWLSGDELPDVNLVEYSLHPTFPQPHVLTQERKSGFRIERVGWGGFRIYLTVHLKDGSTRELSHLLELEEDGATEERPTGQPHGLPAERGLTAGKTVRSLDGGPSVIAEGVTRKVFVISSLADTALVEALRSPLEAEGVAVVSSVELASVGQGLEAEVAELIREVDAAIVLVDPGRSSLWTLRDAELARDAGIPVIPVVIGGGDPSRLPSWMLERVLLHADRDAPERLALEISRAVGADR